MGKRKRAPDGDVIDLTGPEWHGTDSAGASASLRQQEQAPQTSPPKAKRLRKDPQSSDVSLTEKRGAKLKKSCPKNILDRVARVMSQRFFMIDRRREGNELREEFKVLGSTGNVYTVTIGKLPSCDCPDASRGNHCKHILFIYLKVLQVPQSSGLWYQKALLTNELESIFTNAPLAPGVLAHDSVRNAYASATGKNQTAESSSTKRRVPGPEDSCPICYESMHGESEGRLTFCEECGNALHSECFEQWRRSAAKLTCVWCRAEWNKGDMNNSRCQVHPLGDMSILGGLLASAASATRVVIIATGGRAGHPDLEA
ncbi:hypothetical protein EDB92DRAFT_1447818 [Lactarius akahatsu]|uniref:Mitogen-activated protein kinase kinase kinase 1 n=1 Tax=Lactarius akahatsu TaxID=416441 RepID=A0AAD4LS07_9AGAM|nr:hypothetical protein EDB92DRAFT_1447818 [Lactarius akahatsu]